MRIFSTLSLFVFLSITAMPSFVSAQVESFTTSPDPIITLDPVFPKPGEEVTAKLGLNPGQQSSIWYYDGEVLPEAKNSSKATFLSDISGDTKIVSVVITKNDGSQSTIRKSVRTGYIDIIVEPQTHVPDFYLGRSMPSVGSAVNLKAVLTGFDSPSSYVYTWRFGRVVIDGESVRGRDSVTFEVPISGRNIILSLEIKDFRSNPRGELVAEKIFSVPSINPLIRFYESNTLFGLQQIPVGKNLALLGNSLVVRAEPYYLDSRVFNDPSILEWKIDNKVYENPTNNPYEITLQKNASAGRSRLNFHVRDTTQLLQGAYGNVDINL